MSHFDPGLDENTRKAREHFIDSREKQLQGAAVESADSAIKFLFTTNAGGAIAVLAYLGAISTSSTIGISLKLSLAFFFIGVVIIGIYRAFVVHIRMDIFYHFQSITKEYFKEKYDWDAYFKEVEKKVNPNKIPYYLGYGSFACFLLGSGSGVAGLFCG